MKRKIREALEAAKDLVRECETDDLEAGEGQCLVCGKMVVHEPRCKVLVLKEKLDAAGELS